MNGKGIFNSVINLMMSSRCWGCDTKSREVLCRRCMETVMPILHACARCGIPYPQPVPICGRCVDRKLYLDSTVSLYLYQSPLREVIHTWKYKRSRRAWLIIRGLFIEGLKHKSAELKNLRTEMVIPVPLHWRRRWGREFNQSMLLAQELGRMLDLPVETTVKRKRYTKPQTGLHMQKRRMNVRGAFTLKGDVKGCSLLLVDDVATTLSTASEIAKTLVKGGAREVHLLTMARAVE